MTATATALWRSEPRRRAHSGATEAGAGIAVWLLLLPLLLAPVPLASVGEQPRALLAAALGATAAVVLVRAIRLGRPLPLPPAALALALLVALALLQLLPIAAGGGERAASVLAGLEPRTLSVLPMRTWPRACELLATLGLFVAASLLFARRARARTACLALLGLGATLAVYGLLLQRSVLPPIDPQQTRAVLVATYFNRNHFAGLLEMAALAGTGVFCARLGRGAVPWQQALLGCGIAACVLGLIGTESRGGLVAFVLGAAVFVALAPTRHQRGTLALLGIATVLALWLVPDSLLARLQHVAVDATADGSRPDIWRGTVALWRAFPWFGCGLGTYADLSPATQLPHTGGHLEHAHSDPLELLAETGIVGTSLLLAAAFLFVRQTVRQRACQGDRERAWLAAGATAAVAAIAAHGAVDFNLQIPANAAWFAVLAGIATGLRGGLGSMRLPRPLAAAAVVLLFATAAVSLQRAVTGADDGIATVIAGQRQLRQDPVAAAAMARTALVHNPLSPSAHQLLGEALTRLRDPGATQAFAHALHWTDAGIRARRQFEVGIACLGGGDLDAAQRWLHPLFACAPGQWPQLLAELHASAPVYELMAVLVPATPPALRRALADELLRSGDLAGRERELAAARGDATPAMLTLGDGVRLLHCELQDLAVDDAAAVGVTLGFAIDAAARPDQVTLRCSGDGAAMARAFVPGAEPFRWTFRFDANWPPGECVLTLDFGSRQQLELGRVQRPGSPIELQIDDLQRALPTLYWSSADPYRRDHRDGGLLLQPGDRLWRDLVLPDTAATLVLRCGGSGALQVAWAGSALVCDSAAGSPVQRFRLRGPRRGRLVIDNGGARELVVQDYFVTAGRQR